MARCAGAHAAAPALLAETNPRATVVAQNLLALQAACPGLLPLCDPAVDWRKWQHFMGTELLKPDAARQFLRSEESSLVQERTKVFQDFTVAPPPAAALARELRPPERARISSAAKALKSHMTREHGCQKMPRKFAASSRCPARGKDYGPWRKALGHLERRAIKCRRRTESGELHELPPELLAQLGEQDPRAS